MRPSDHHKFSLNIGELGPYYTIRFDLRINSIRPGKAFIFRIGNSTTDPEEIDDKIVDMKDDHSCGHEILSIATKEDGGNNHLEVKFGCNKQNRGKDIRFGVQPDCQYRLYYIAYTLSCSVEM